jgi:tetratricopeptide (TPR) repeat protein
MKTYHLRVFPQTREVSMLQFQGQNGKADERPLDQESIERFSREVEEDYRKVAPSLSRLGQLLYEWIDGPTHRWLERIVNDPEGVALHIDVEERLRHLPWELMASGYTYLCANPLRPFTPVRRVTNNSVPTKIENRPLRMLFMVTSPEDVRPVLDFEGEERRILQYIVRHFGRDCFDVFHLSGHADVIDGVPRFVMENNLGLRQDATADEIARAFVGMWPRLIFLSGCKTGQASDQGGLPSMSEALVSAGAPAVLGWALPVGDGAASILAPTLYSLLATGTRVDEAVARARQHLFEQNNPNWHLLRLYTDATPLSEIVTPPPSLRRWPKQGRQASEDFLDALGKSKVTSRETFVGRRRPIQRCLRALSRSDSTGKVHQSLLIHGMAGLGKSTLAARICERMSNTHQRAVWLGRINEQEVLSLTRKVAFPDIEMLATTNSILNEKELDLQTWLEYLLRGPSGPMATMPCLFIFDDFEDGNLELSASGEHRLTPEALDVLKAFLGAIHSANSASRVIITSRYQFPMPEGYNIFEEGLESLRGAELEKKLRLSSALGIDSETPKELREKAIATAAGNPGLLEWLDRVLLDPQSDHDAILSAMAARAEEFREQVLAEKLLEAQGKALQRFLALANVFQLPVPLEAVGAVADDSLVKSHLSRAVSLGLLEAGIDSIEGKPQYLVSNVLAPLIEDAITDDERKDAYRASARSLYHLWISVEAKTTTEEQLLEVHRLALLGIAADIARDVTSQLARSWLGLSRFREVRELCTKTLELGPDPDTFVHLARAKRVLGEVDEAMRLYRDALKIYEEVGDRAGLAVTLNNIGEVYRNTGQPDQALEYYHQVLPISEEVGDRGGIAQTLNNIGGVYSNIGQPDQALEYFNQALPILQEVGNRAGQAVTLNNIGMVYRSIGQPDQALEYLTQALPISEEVGDRAGLATTLNNIGGVYSNTGQPDQALEYLTQALPISEEVGNRAGQAVTLNNIGMVYRSIGQPDQALEYYHQALPIRMEVGDRAGQATTRFNLAMIYRAQGRLREAVEELKQVVELDQLIQSPDLESDRAVLAQVQEEIGAS